MDKLRKITAVEDIPVEHRRSPIGLLLEYHNMNRPLDPFTQAKLLVGMCMDHRKSLRMPDNFAYIIRTGGANLRYSEFKVSYAIGVGGVSHIALIAHDGCGMVNLTARKKQFIDGLVERAGWTREAAEEHFMNLAPMFEIENETEFILTEARRLRRRYGRLSVAPLLYRIEDNMLYLINE
ncbi:MAG TPA: carbonic anhydrase [bacterium]|nr:carbonic anhydrase [bacterium]